MKGTPLGIVSHTRRLTTLKPKPDYHQKFGGIAGKLQYTKLPLGKLSSSFIYTGSIIHSLSKEKLEILDCGVIVVSNGKIAYLGKVGNLCEIKKKYGIREEQIFSLSQGQLLMPGFIDTHIHAPQYPNAGLGYDMTLLQWLEAYTFPLEKLCGDSNYAESVYEAVVKKTIVNGSTTCCYFATIHEGTSILLAKIAQKFGQRAFVGKVNMIRNAPEDYCETREESLTKTKLFIQEVKALEDDLIKPIITPRFALSCDMQFMKELSEIAAKEGLCVQTHVSENLEEIEKVSQQYPDCSNYVGVYDKAGLLTNKTVLAHGVHLNHEEIKILKEKNSAISHCPISNNMLQSGLCPVRQLLNSGVKMCLGTDCSGGYSCSMLDVMRQAIHSSVQAQFNGLGAKLSPTEVFYLATLAGAEALDIAHVTGNFGIGKDFDAIIVDVKIDPAIELLENYTTEQLFQKFLHLGDDRMISKVYVAGRVVLDT